MKTRIIVNGAYGKMGTMACETLANHPDFSLVAQVTRGDDLQAAIESTKAQIVLELTNAASVYKNSLTIIECNARPVIGATGLNEQAIKTLQTACAEKKLGGIIAPNFSIAALLMMRFSAMAARFMPEVEIIETHHQQKLDAPSGTALKTAELIAASRKQENKASLTIQESLPGTRGGTHHGVNLHALRLPGVLASQQVIFGAPGETLTIHHNSIARSAFMPGIILACQRVQELNTLYYGLESLLEEPRVC